MLLEKRIKGISLMMTICALGASLAWFYISFLIVFNGYGGLNLRSPASIDSYNVIAIIIILGTAIDYFRTTTSREYNLYHYNKWGFSFFAAVQQCITLLLILSLYVTIAKDHGVSRMFLIWFLTGLIPVLTFIHRLLPQWLAEHLFAGRYRYEAVIVSGVHAGQERVRAWLSRQECYGVNAQENIYLEGLEAGDHRASEKVMETLTLELQKRKPAMVIMHQFPIDSGTLSKLKQLCDRLGCRLIIALDMDAELADAVSFHKDGDMQLISMREEPLECPTNRLLKRALDVLVALPVVMFILPPLSLWVWWRLRRQSPGPLFHRQMRSGMQNEHFVLYKFRSMHTGHGAESRQASKDDDRVFPFGRWMRRSSVDEIPQFINVLVGDMSVVGPRPHLPQHDEKFAQIVDHYNLRQLVKPGITGLAQVKGFRGEILDDSQISDRLRSDVFYIENWSLKMELEIIFKTALQMIRNPLTAY